MGKHSEFPFRAGLIIGCALAAVGWRLYSRRPRERTPSLESLDDPEVARAYAGVARMPQMRLLRWFAAWRANSMRPRGVALDLGCGPGLFAIELARQVPGLKVIGVDLSEEMLVRGEANARRAGRTERVSFRLGDAHRIPFLAGSLDMVVSTLSLHHWGDPGRVLDEIARVLRPGGAFLIFDVRRDLGPPAWLLIGFVQNVVVPPALRQVNEPLGSFSAAYTPAEAAQLARQSRLSGWRVTHGPLWLTIEGRREV